MTLKLIFRDPYIPPELLERIETEAQNQLPQIFGSSEALMKAFEQHSKSPQPNDPFSTGINEVIWKAQKVITEQCGPSAARYLVPVITNEKN